MIEILIGTGAAVAPLLWGVARALLGRSRRWHERRLRRIPRVPIADAPEGRTIFLVGHLVGLPPHEAPFTGRRC